MDLGLLQRELAPVLGCSKAALLMWEKGHSKPETRFWPAIIRFLGYDPSAAPKTTAQGLKAVRRINGWSQSRLARALGVDPSAVRNWESGREPQHRRCIRAVQALLLDLGL